MQPGLSLDHSYGIRQGLVVGYRTRQRLGGAIDQQQDPDRVLLAARYGFAVALALAIHEQLP
ncbi:Uncharacterised protein [Amycolatopsis camponoti]|uniref:Uncharacterized protein n=1 Tax=Amycolatopsis camponoti TaxID=2606593 RepID=A0A6I8LVI7_9PSEU|nr:hypothetical protein [Amycolatopsis camponoti]VVJ19615.1 Uncharacterised protein [Amycolatopsis camponoti]